MTRTRNGLVEVLRFVGAIGIVWFHAQMPGAWIGHAALDLFAILTVFFICGSSRSLSLQDIVKNRAQKLLLVWLSWSAIYAMAKFVDVFYFGKSFSDEFNITMLLYGPTIHLWFLPAIFIFSVFSAVLIKIIPNDLIIFLLVLGASLAIKFGETVFDYTTTPPFREWVHTIPAAFLGIALYVAQKKRAWLAISIAAYAILFGATLDIDVGKTIFALLVTILAMLIYIPSAKWDRQLGGYSLTIYLVHPLIYAILNRFVPEIGPILIVFAVIALSVFTAIVLANSPRLVQRVLLA